MESIFRTVVSGPSRLIRHRQPLVLPALGPSRTPLRFLSTSLLRAAPEPDQTPPSNSFSRPTPNASSKPQPFRFIIPQAPVEEVDPDAWWKNLSARRSNARGYVLPKYASRSFLVSRQKSGFKLAVVRMKRVLRDANLRKKVRLDQYHEVDSVKRRRLKSERHRRRFQALVSVCCAGLPNAALAGCPLKLTDNVFINRSAQRSRRSVYSRGEGRRCN